MNKKIFSILIVAIFLIIGINSIAAADDFEVDGIDDTLENYADDDVISDNDQYSEEVTSDAPSDNSASSKTIKVKLKWNDGNQNTKRPGKVTVYLLKDGKVVDKAILDQANSWSATFKVNGDGKYSVKQEDNINGYSSFIEGSEESGFTITNTLKLNILGISKNTPAKANNATGLENNTTDNTNKSSDNKNTTNKSTENNKTNKNTSGNTTVVENKTNTTIISQQNNTTNITKKVEPQKTVQKIDKKEDKKPNATKHNLKNTGIPLIGLVILAAIAIFVPFARKK